MRAITYATRADARAARTAIAASLGHAGPRREGTRAEADTQPLLIFSLEGPARAAERLRAYCRARLPVRTLLHTDGTRAAVLWTDEVAGLAGRNLGGGVVIPPAPPPHLAPTWDTASVEDA